MMKRKIADRKPWKTDLSFMPHSDIYVLFSMFSKESNVQKCKIDDETESYEAQIGLNRLEDILKTW